MMLPIGYKERQAARRKAFENAYRRDHECACVKAEKTVCGVEGECFHFAGFRAPKCRNCQNTGIQNDHGGPRT